MRMRKKRNVDERMKHFIDSIVLPTDFGTLNMREAAEKVRILFDFGTIFGNSNAVEMEIGCGKGAFIAELATRCADTNFLAVEKITNVMVQACETVFNAGANNVRFLNCPAEVLPCCIPTHSISCLYINFPTPLPTQGKAAQRLTAPYFLQMYKSFLTDNGRIVLKTDDADMFRYSAEMLSANGYNVYDICLDLAALGDTDNIVTEHERRFREEGKPIYRLFAKPIA